MDMARRLDRQRFAMRVVTLFAEPNDYSAELTQLGAPQDCLGLAGPRDLPRGIVRLERLLRSTPTDLVHTHLFCANIVGRLAARLRGVPVVSTLHAADYEPAARLGNPGLRPWKHELLRHLDRLSIMASGAHAVAVSDYVAMSARRRLGVSPPRLRTILNGIDLGRFQDDGTPVDGVRTALGIPADSLLVLCVGRLSLEKGQDLLLHALARDELRDIPLEVHFVGEGGARSKYESLATTLGIAGRVHFLGARHDVPALMRAADFLVHCARDEGFGLILAEALAAGRPVVASRVPAVLELVHDGETGLLFASGDVAALARAVRQMALDPEGRRSMALKGRQHAQARLGVEHMLEALSALYVELATSRQLGLPR